jgi:hypothetical protein
MTPSEIENLIVAIRAGLLSASERGEQINIYQSHRLAWSGEGTHKFTAKMIGRCLKIFIGPRDGFSKDSLVTSSYPIDLRFESVSFDTSGFNEKLAYLEKLDKEPEA